MAARPPFPFEKKEPGAPVHPATLFTKAVDISSLQTMLIEKLLVTHREVNLSGPVKESIKNICRPKLAQELLQAMIDDDHQTVRVILDFDPELLLVEPASVGINEIESKKTWQRFLTERPFIMAQKLKRLAMTKTLLPYFKRLASDKKDEKPEIVKQWILPPLASDAEQKEKDEKLQQKYIKEYFEPLIETIATDNDVKVKWELNSETNLYEAHIEGMNKTTEAVLESFRKRLLPDVAIAIDNDVDNEQFQMAVCKAYEILFDKFKNWDQRNVFTICVIGFGESLSAPELGASYCEGLYDVVNYKKPISARAQSHKMADGRDLYRLSRDSLSGLGFSFRGSIFGLVSLGGGVGLSWVRVHGPRLENYVKQKQQSLENLRDECTPKRSMLPQLSHRVV